LLLRGTELKIQHHPLFDTAKIEEHYTQKDGVEVKYVCTTDLTASDVPVDVFYRETPHPTFGNRYFGLYYDRIRNHMMITNADIVESFEFGMIEDDQKWHYSQSHHDYKVVGGHTIDGGRAYTRGSGYKMFKIKDGEFIRDYGESLTNWIKKSEEKSQ
jgi:hypothetical protein